MRSTIELKDFLLNVSVGSYDQGQHKPDHHLLDLTLEIDSRFVFIDEDSMDNVFDYDPLVDEISNICEGQHVITQEILLTRILHACRRYSPPLISAEVYLRKVPVNPNGGTLGLRHKAIF
jgi:dihydroneopterin aldolase